MKRELFVVFLIVLCNSSSSTNPPKDRDGLTEEFIEQVFLGSLGISDPSLLTGAQRKELEADKKLTLALANARHDPEQFKKNFEKQIEMVSGAIVNENVSELVDMDTTPISESLEMVLNYVQKSEDILAGYRPILANVSKWVEEVQGLFQPEKEYRERLEELIVNLISKKEDLPTIQQKYRELKDLKLLTLSNKTQQSKAYDERTDTNLKLGVALTKHKSHDQGLKLFLRHLAILQVKLDLVFDPLSEDGDYGDVQFDHKGMEEVLKSYQKLEGQRQNYLTIKNEEQRQKKNLEISAVETKTRQILQKNSLELSRVTAYVSSIQTLARGTLAKITEKKAKFFQLQQDHMHLMAEGINLDSELCYWMEDGMRRVEKPILPAFGDPDAIRRIKDIHNSWRKKRFGNEEAKWKAARTEL